MRFDRKLNVNETQITDKQQIYEEIQRYFASVGLNLAKDIPPGILSPTAIVENVKHLNLQGFFLVKFLSHEISR